MRLRRRSNLARPSPCRFSSFSRLIWPSTGPLLHGCDRAPRTAARSPIIPATKPLNAVIRAAVSQTSNAAASRSRRMRPNSLTAAVAARISGARAVSVSTNCRSARVSLSAGVVSKRAARRLGGTRPDGSGGFLSFAVGTRPPPRLAAKGKADLLLDFVQPHGTPRLGPRNVQALGEDAAPALQVRAAEAPDTDLQFDNAPLPRQVGQTSRIDAMRTGARAAAQGASSADAARAGNEEDAIRVG